MQIHPMASAGNSAGTTTTAGGLNNMFLQLLTAQLQNQDPLNPVDPTQFTSQLVQFNMLDQLSQINQTLTNAFSPLTPASGSASAVQGAQ